MASWTQYPENDLRSAHCPVHGSHVVKRGPWEWMVRCAACLADGYEATLWLLGYRP